jgi:prepilin-type N-terminal cleavage/methylation domain-containing protein
VHPTGDDGFTLVEVLISIAIMSTVMLALSTSFVVTVRVTQQQGNKQAAIQAADDAMERARALQVSAMLTGRDKESTTQQWATATGTGAGAIPGISGVLTAGATTDNGVIAYDTGASTGDGPSATLPTTYMSLTLNGAGYRQYWFIEYCQRKTDQVGADCTSGLSLVDTAAARYIPFYRVVVAVTWPDRLCSTGTCAYFSTSLIGERTDEPVFDNSADIPSAPDVVSPGTQTNDINLPLSLTLTESGGGGTLTWTATGLPTGLTIDSLTGVISGTPTTAATYGSATVTVVDTYTQKDFVTFSWVINKALTFVNPGTISTPAGTAYSKTFAATYGTTPYTWTASGTWGSTGLPPGLSLDATTGIVSGTPTTVGSKPVAMTVTDKFGQAVTQSFTWTVPALAVSTTWAAPASTVGTSVSTTLAATGGIPPYTTWAVTNLPTGLTLNSSTGAISGTPVQAKTYAVVITVTDSAGTTASRSVNWKVS